MLRSRANEIHELVRRLGSRNPSQVEAARARLSILGSRAVEDLIAALEGENSRIRARVMPLLALIQDPRGREPLIATVLLDRNARLREIAARCLARFPSVETVCALNRVLQKERREREEVRVGAVQSLVQQYASGREEALRMVLELLADAQEVPSVRLAALALLPQLRPSERRDILERLKQDPSQDVRQRAQELDSDVEGLAGTGPQEVLELIRELGSSRWDDVVQQLMACGASAIQPLLDEMQSRAHDPEFCTRAGMVLKGLGPRRGRALAEALDQIQEPLPLQVLVEAIGALGEKSLIYRLQGVIERIASQARHAGRGNGPDLMQRVRAKAHLELARIGSRVAIHDLREALIDTNHRLELELIAAIGLIGTREEIGLLLQAYGREDGYMQEQIAKVVRAIMRRERLRRNSKLLQALDGEQRRALAEILPPGRGAVPLVPSPSAR